MAEIIYEADYPSGGQKTGIMSIGGVARTLSATDYKQPPSIVLPVLTPEREEKRQNGRRFKDNNEDMFTLTAQDRHGVALGVLRNVRSEYGKEIRKDYESGNIDISRHEFLEHEIREDGISNTVDSVQKDNLVAISVPEVIGGIGEEKSNNGTQFFQQDRIYDTDHVAPSLQANLPGGSNKVAIKVKEATKKGYAVAHEGDSINLSMPNSKTRRGRIGGGGGSNTRYELQSGCDRDDQGEYP